MSHPHFSTVSLNNCHNEFINLLWNYNIWYTIIESSSFYHLFTKFLFTYLLLYLWRKFEYRFSKSIVFWNLKKIGVESFSIFLFSFLSQASIILIKLQLKISFDCLIVKSQQQYAYLIWEKVPNKKCPLIFHRWFTYSCTLNVSAKYNTSPSPTESTVPLR